MDEGEDGHMTGLEAGRGITAWRQIADALREEIARSYGPGEKLPTEAVLAQRFAVNRHTVRRALLALAEAGLVRSSRGSGSFVEEPRLAYPIGARTRFSEIVSALGRVPDGRLLGANEVAASAEIAALLAVAAGSPVLSLRGVRHADGVPISCSESWLPLPRFEGFDTVLRDGETLSAAFEHYGVGDYRRASTRVSARIALPGEAELLELAPGRIVLVVDAVNVDREGVPVQATAAQFSADRVEIVMEAEAAEKRALSGRRPAGR